MKTNYTILVFASLVIVIAVLLTVPMTIFSGSRDGGIEKNGKRIDLPKPGKTGTISLQKALEERRSIRNYQDSPLSLQEISELAWSAQGVTSGMGGRTAPSAGALYPLRLYLVVERGRDIKTGVYRYLPEDHELLQLSNQKVARELANAALGQMFIAKAPLTLVISGNYAATTSKYRERGTRYVHMEAGHAAQNVYLQAEKLGLGTVTVGAFVDGKIKQILDLPEEQTPLYLLPVGKPD